MTRASVASAGIGTGMIVLLGLATLPLVDTTGNFLAAFLAAAGFALAAVASWAWLVGPVHEVDWK